MDDCGLETFSEWIEGKDYIIAKPNDGAQGKQIEKIAIKGYSDIGQLFDHLRRNNLNLVEDLIKQHPTMNELNPSSVNTLRIITVRGQNHTDIVASVLRIGVSNYVDNFSSGGIAAPINIETGRVTGPAVAKGNSLKYEHHPLTNHKIEGFQVPYWNEIIDMVQKASDVVPSVRTVGWDIAVTSNGPELVEGNDNWNKDSFQLPYGQGRKSLLDKYTG